MLHVLKNGAVVVGSKNFPEHYVDVKRSTLGEMGRHAQDSNAQASDFPVFYDPNVDDKTAEEIFASPDKYVLYVGRKQVSLPEGGTYNNISSLDINNVIMAAYDLVSLAQ